jgi:hypothetical protein
MGRGPREGSGPYYVLASVDNLAVEHHHITSWVNNAMSSSETPSDRQRRLLAVEDGRTGQRVA